MDNYSKMTEPNFYLPFFNLATGIIMVFFFGVYAFANPDRATCFAGTADQHATQFSETTPTDVGSEFYIYFLMGFIVNLVGLLGAILVIAGILLKWSMLYALGHSINCLGMCMSFGLIITGTVFRFRHEGKVCSGVYYLESYPGTAAGDILDSDFLFSSGRFIKIYLII